MLLICVLAPEIVVKSDHWQNLPLNVPQDTLWQLS